ncbi:MAG: biotin/lipoyl-containing protein [Steroidobacteraceae bacterium]
MSLTAKDVAEISRLLDESEFDELHLELDGMKLSMRRGGSADPTNKIASSAEPPPAVAAAGAEPASPVVAPGADPAGLHTVTAPLLGTFYRAPRPGAPPYVEIGSEVEPDTVIGILEVMKLMNTVRAGAHGRVAQILARDGALVEYGEALLRVSRVD